MYLNGQKINRADDKIYWHNRFLWNFHQDAIQSANTSYFLWKGLWWFYEDEFVRLVVGDTAGVKGPSQKLQTATRGEKNIHRSRVRGCQGVITRGRWDFSCNGHDDAIFSYFMIIVFKTMEIYDQKVWTQFGSDIQGPLQDEYFDPLTSKVDSNDGSNVGTSSHDES